jgi:hypothetical protein
MPETSLPVEHLFTFTCTVTPMGMVASGPAGTKVIVNAGPGTLEGPNIKGTVKSPSGDWVTARPDGSLSLDLRVLIETDDGAIILMTYLGISPDGGKNIRCAPLFQTGDERYAWLNNLQAVGIGVSGGGTATYEVYKLV